MKTVIIYCDGSTLRNGKPDSPGAGASILGYNDIWKAAAEFMAHSTNQTAEITAACVGLESLKEPCNVILRTDSEYVTRTMNGEYRKKANIEYWERLGEAAKAHNVTWEWCKGHNLHPQQEEADRLAGFVARGGLVSDFVIDFTQHENRRIKREARLFAKTKI